LDIFRRRRLSSRDLFLSFGAIAFPVHFWAIIFILDIFPAWLLRFSIWDLSGAIGYALVDALLESFLLWMGLVVISYILPRKWFANKFVALSSALVWSLTAWAVLIQFFYQSFLHWGLIQVLPGLLLVAFSFCLVYWLVQRYEGLGSWIKRLAQGLAILAYFYVIFDLLGLVLVILRNLRR
jgi:hypothetical protein